MCNCIARLRKRLKDGDPDMKQDEIASVIEKKEARREQLWAAQPDAKAGAKILTLLPKAAAMYAEQIDAGLGGNEREAARARAILRGIVGGKVTLQPDYKAGHLVAKFGLHRMALVAAANSSGSVGSGGRT